MVLLEVNGDKAAIVRDGPPTFPHSPSFERRIWKLLGENDNGYPDEDENYATMHIIYDYYDKVSSRMKNLISRVERMGSMGWLQPQLWWGHTDKGEGVQEEKVVGCCYNNLFIIFTTITIIIVTIIKFFMIAISLNQLSTSTR